MYDIHYRPWTDSFSISSYFLARKDEFAYWVAGVAGIGISTFGIIGNILVILIFTQLKQKTSSSLNLMALAVTDIICLMGISKFVF